jgi:general secretion pathway protein A
LYTDYWRLREKPFENNWDLRFYYLSNQHKEVLTRLLYAAREHRQGALLTGEHGSGKSMVLALLINKLQSSGKEFSIIHIKDPLIGIEEFYIEFLSQLGEKTESSEKCASKSALFKRFNEQLVKISDNSMHTLLIVDEAHLLEKKNMEELRLLLNNYHPSTNASMLTLVLAGQPHLADIVSEMPALSQRMPIRCNFPLLDEEQCEDYIFHRLRVAGSQNQLFTPDAVRLIEEYSRGIPRSINNICDMALFLGSSRGAAKIDGEIIEEVARDIEESLQ